MTTKIRSLASRKHDNSWQYLASVAAGRPGINIEHAK